MERGRDMPVRVQRKRLKGWRMPENSVYVGRPSEWENPWKVGRDGDVAYCVRQYRLAITGEKVDAWPKTATDRSDAVRIASAEWVAIRLRGKNLACWCPLDQPCHADVLLGRCYISRTQVSED